MFPILSYIFQPVSGHYVAARKKININIAYESFTMLSTWGPTFSADLAELYSPGTGDTGKRAQKNTKNRDMIHQNFGDITNVWIRFYFQYMAIGIC
jgi:hypothetical protein